MGHDVLTLPAAGEQGLFDRVDTLILVDTAPSPLVRRAHVVIPALHLLEKRGTVTSGDGRVQRVAPARRPGFPALAEGDFVTRLARRLGVEGFEAPWDPAAVSRAIGDAHPAFADRDWDAVGEGGLPLAKRSRRARKDGR
jgi:predicted molibdopterin-dependent oxidoreductase YjgC